MICITDNNYILYAYWFVSNANATKTIIQVSEITTATVSFRHPSSQSIHDNLRSYGHPRLTDELLYRK